MKTSVRNHHHRRGITVLEVVISIFVLSFGLLGVLAMFAAGRSVSATLRVQTSALTYAYQVTLAGYVESLKVATWDSGNMASRCYPQDYLGWAWSKSPAHLPADWITSAGINDRLRVEKETGRGKWEDHPPMDSLFGVSAPVVAIDPCGLFTEQDQTAWDPTSRYLMNIDVPTTPATPLVAAPRIALLPDPESWPRKPALTLQAAQSRFTGVDDVEYDPPTILNGPPTNAFEGGRRRTGSDYTFALFLILGGTSITGNRSEGPWFYGYRELIGVFHKRQTLIADPTTPGLYKGPEGCVFSGNVSNVDNMFQWTLLPNANAEPLVPTFPGYNDGTPESVRRAAGYIKPGKLLLVRRPDIPTDSLVNQWSFQRVISCSRKGTSDDDQIDPKWLIITTPAVSGMDDINAMQTSSSNSPFLAIAFDGLVLVKDRYGD